MSDATLTKQMGAVLLSRLAEDDGFRARFEVAPARALVELGVPAELVVNLKADCLERRRLASKETFEQLLAENTTDIIGCAMQMAIPKLEFGDVGAQKQARIATTAQVGSREGAALH